MGPLGFSCETNITELPYRVFDDLALSFESNDLWTNIFGEAAADTVYHMWAEEIERLKRGNNVGTTLLRMLGNKGVTVKNLLDRLNLLAKTYGPAMDRPQFVLRRQFREIIWAKACQVVVTVVGDGKKLKLECRPSGFPTPLYQWMEDGNAIEGATSSTLVVSRCSCTARNVFSCRTYNEIMDGDPWSEYYRKPPKPYKSELISNVVDLKKYAVDPVMVSCDLCTHSMVAEIYRHMNGVSISDRPQNEEEREHDPMMSTDQILVAADKVALIISNRSYAPQMPNLITPHCDAQTLAEILQQQGFKTVTLSDLNLEEMKHMIKEYRKLLGTDVYAVFYFVGHGFQANGQCYLLPIGAPAENYGPEDCLSMDWVLSIFKDYEPALNLILLDICRKFVPANIEKFTAYAENFHRDYKVCRNIVYGYATSGGVGAYEVKGERNGVFMKYLKNRITKNMPVMDMLRKVFRDIEKDDKVRDVQIPELGSNLTLPRSLHDTLDYHGHTTSHFRHNVHWQLMHQLPDPVRAEFPEQKLQVTIWFSFVGKFTNMVYVFSNVDDLRTEEENDEAGKPSENALAHLAYLTFPAELEGNEGKICEDDDEGVSLRFMLANLQKAKTELKCDIALTKEEDDFECIVATKTMSLGHVLITQIF